MDTLVTLKVYSSIELANLAKDFLEDHGISASIHVDESAGMNPSASLSSGILLLVSLRDLEKAQELLQIP